MDIKKIYSLVLVFFMVMLTACGTDTKENPPEPDGPFSFFNATTPLKITAQAENIATDSNGTANSNLYEIKVQLLKYGLAAPGESIQMKPFDAKYGFVTNTIESTDRNGFAIFTYNLPEKYSDVRGQEITIQAVFLNPESKSRTPDVLLRQDFVLQFR